MQAASLLHLDSDMQEAPVAVLLAGFLAVLLALLLAWFPA
jgi:hypothetical protein